MVTTVVACARLCIAVLAKRKVRKRKLKAQFCVLQVEVVFGPADLNSAYFTGIFSLFFLIMQSYLASFSRIFKTFAKLS